MTFIKKCFQIFYNIFFNPNSIIRYYLFDKLNNDNYFRNKFKKKYKISNYFINENFKNKLYLPQYHYLDNLINFINRIKPKLILELGEKYSTVAIAIAPSQNLKKFRIKGKLFSYDPNKEYLEITKQILPDYLKDIVKFKFSRLKEKKIENVKVSLYEDLEIKERDLVYKDRFFLNPKFNIGGDIFLLYQKTDNFPSIIVAGHLKTISLLKQKIDKYYNINVIKIFKQTNFEKR